ncbi:MAG: metal ABC transporter substrate-binding protein [Actinomycetes bacterium]
MSSNHRRIRACRPLRIVGGAATIVLVATMLGATSCTTHGNQAGFAERNTTPSRPRIVATTTMLGDVVRAVAGEHADVSVLMAPGDDPHTFTLRSDQAELIDRADLIVTTGLGFESALQPELDRAQSPGLSIMRAAQDVAPLAGPGGDVDPHVWMDADRLTTIASQLGDRLATIAPEFETNWRDGAAKFGSTLAAADESVQTLLSAVPGENRQFVTTSDGLGYFAPRYGLNPIAATGAPGERVLNLSVDSLGPAGSATETNAGLIVATAARIAGWLQTGR